MGDWFKTQMDDSEVRHSRGDETYLKNLFIRELIFASVMSGMLLIGFLFAWYVNAALGGLCLIVGLVYPLGAMFHLYIARLKWLALVLLIYTGVVLFIIVMMSIAALAGNWEVAYGTFCFLCAIYPLLFICCLAETLYLYMMWKQGRIQSVSGVSTYQEPSSQSSYVPPPQPLPDTFPQETFVQQDYVATAPPTNV